MAPGKAPGISGTQRVSLLYFLEESQGRTPTDIAPGTKVHELVEELARCHPEKEKTRFL